MEDGSFAFLSKPPKRKKETDFEKCVICQSNSDQNLRQAKESSISKLTSACEIRQDDVFHRISGVELKEKKVLWHSSCYECYTSKENLRYVSNTAAGLKLQPNCIEPEFRPQRIPFEWQLKCIFCKQVSRKKDKNLIKIITPNGSQSIRQAIKDRGDVELLAFLESVDLIAVSARYHKDCHASYTSTKNIRSRQYPAKSTFQQDVFGESFEEFLEGFKPAIDAGKALDMNSLLQSYRECLQRRGIDGSSYTRQKLKDRLKVVFKDSLVFHQPFGPSKPEIVFSASISLLDVINAAASSTQVNTETTFTSCTSHDTLEDLYFVALHLRKEIQKCKGIDILPLNLTNLNLQTSKSLLPKPLYWLLRWIVTGEEFGFSQESCLNESDERKVIMMAQDIIHSSSHARVKLPKQVGLAMTVKHLTGSKQLITLLNRMGQCSSYDETEQVETSLANETLARAAADGVIIPSNITQGSFIHMAADNNDINEETLDGKNTTHGTTIVVYQRNENHEPSQRTIYADHSKKRRSLTPDANLINIEEITVRGRRPAIADFVQKINMDWFITSNQVLLTGISDLAWLFLRMSDSEFLAGADVQSHVQARQLQASLPEDLKSIVIRLGGFHIALNYLALIGKKYADSGLEDILVESGVYAAGTTTSLLQGKSYNRGIRAHKLVMEALFRMLWKAFVAWLSSQTKSQFPSSEMSSKLQQCRHAFKGANFNQRWDVLVKFMKRNMTLFFSFVSEAKAKSKVFCFWMEYISVVLLLLQFVKAERIGDWQLHLSSTAPMVPYFYSMNRMNYSRWLPVYLADMNMLQTTHPAVHEEFLNGNHSVSHGRNRFSQVWSDMALEQSINLDSKSKGGIIGTSTREHAVERWFLTAHERCAIAKSIKEMCGLEDAGRVGTHVHKEASKSRVDRDECDVQKILHTFQSGLIKNPFERDDEDDAAVLPLSNLDTGVILPDDIADNILSATAKGKQSMQQFLLKRLNSSQTSFWEPIERLSTPTFNSAIKSSTTKTKDVLPTGNSEREIFGRLLVVARNRDVDLKDVLSYELSRVPMALAYPDGSLRKTSKSNLMPHLEQVSSPSQLPMSSLATAVMVDAMALIHVIKSAGATTFGDLAVRYSDVITKYLTSNSCTRLDLVFDQYLEKSIKAEERIRRGPVSYLEVTIHSPSTPVPKQWSKYMSNPLNKKNLAEFLCNSLKESMKEKLLHTQTVVLAGGFSDGKEAVRVTQGREVSIAELQSDHEEADTRLLLHAKHAAVSHPRIVIQSPDTDVVLIALSHFSEIQCQEMWIKTGTKEQQSCSSLFGIGKSTAWKVLTSDRIIQQHLSTLGDDLPIRLSTVTSAEAFICRLYSTDGKRLEHTDEVRHYLFCQKNSTDKLPPTSESVVHHIKRANFQTAVWKKSLVAMQNLPSPQGNGWEVTEEGQLKPVLMTRSPAPTSIIELTRCQCIRSECKKNCSCKLNNLVCTEACRCMADDTRCGNLIAHINQVPDDDSSDDESDI
ncbi:hypothetical protein AC249_AIPGENE15286 [Exaiptasia diaphana]|nr:hypothetical protein AC249_AIPGENE15286 [Exaiptasia diaphana]